MVNKKISRERRRQFEDRAKQIRLRAQMEHWPTDRIVDAIVDELPEVSRLEAHRFARGWTREELSQAIDFLHRQDELKPPQISSTEICGWEHGRHVPNPDRQDFLARVYRTRPDRLGFGRDHSRRSVAVQPVPGPQAPPLVGAELASSGQGEPRPNTTDPLAGSVLVQPAGGGGIDRRTVIKLLGGLAVTGIPPQLDLDLDHMSSARFAPQHVDSALVQSLRAVTTAYGNQRQTMGPGLLLQPALGHLRYLKGLFDAAPPAPARSELGFVTGEAAILAGWLFMNVTNVEQARRHYRYASDLATDLGDDVLGAYARIFESVTHSRITHAHSPRDTEIALGMLDEAASVAAKLPAPMRARLSAQQAEEYAILKKLDDCYRALERARKAADEITDPQRTGLFSDWTEARLPVYEGTCQLIMGEFKKATATLERAVAGVSEGSGVGLVTEIDLGTSYIQQGEVEQGANLLGDAYQKAKLRGHKGIMRRAHKARERLEPLSDLPAVRDLDERLALT